MKCKMLIGILFTSFLFVGSITTVAASASKYNEGFVAAESRDYDSAFKYWEPLAKQGFAAAQFNLALMYHSGLGVKQDETKALIWYKKAAKNGSSLAQEYLAVGYQEGWYGLKKDIAQAEYWSGQLDISK